MRIKVNKAELCVETFGDPADPPVLLIGVTMLSWPDEFCASLAGRYVSGGEATAVAVEIV